MCYLNKKEISNTFYVIRFFALCAIVLAHSTFKSIPDEFVVRILNAFARSGVIMFFITSGYYFNKQRYNNVLVMLKSKIVPIIIPWLIWGITAYLLRFAREPLYFKPTEIIQWVLGGGTYLWFLTILIVLLCIYQMIPNSKEVLLGLVLITLVSIVFSANNISLFKVLRVNHVSRIFIYLDTYLNVLNWIGFFSIGMLVKRYEIFEKYGEIIQSKKKELLIFLLPILLFMIVVEKGDSYWTNSSVFIELTFFVLLVVLSTSFNDIKILRNIGAVSLPIYLLHMQIQGIIFNKILPQSIIMGVLRPIIVIISIYYLLLFGLYVSTRIHMEKTFKVIFGLK